MVEDNVFVAKAYASGLRARGYDVTLETDGGNAISKVAEIQPDILILDLILPNQTGFQILETLRAQKPTQDLPVIVFSSLGQDSDITEIMEKGANDYVVKSHTNVGELSDHIEALLDSGKVNGTAGAIV